MRDSPRLIPGWSRPLFPTWRQETLFGCRLYPASPFRDSQIIKIVGLPIAGFGLRLLVVVESSPLGFSDAISLGEDSIALGSGCVFFSCFLIVTHRTEILQISEGVLSAVLKGYNMVNMPTPRTHTHTATALANIIGPACNECFDWSGYCCVMVVAGPLSPVLLPYAARH
jgi:hypothetical protein